MSLITILIGLFMERFLGSLEEFRRFDWFYRFADWLRRRLPSGSSGWDASAALLALLLPALATGWLFDALRDFWGFAAFLFALAMLLYSIGPRDLEAETEAFLDAYERGDHESACHHAEDLLRAGVPDSSEALGRRIAEEVLVEAHERLLGVIFWFVLLGPMGAILYRLAVLLRGRERKGGSGFWAAADAIHYLLAWLPIRLTALGYAVAGSFVDAVQRWRVQAGRHLDLNRGVLTATGLGALGLDETIETPSQEVRAALDLVRRAVAAWLVVLALLTLAGWGG